MILSKKGVRSVVLEQLVELLPEVKLSSAASAIVEGITYDSRQVRPGYIFVALSGQHEDGSRFVVDAAERGAVALLTEKTMRAPAGMCRLLVPDARDAMARLSAGIYGHPDESLNLIGITGTNGKTSTAFMCKAILDAANQKAGLIGTVHYVLGRRMIPAMRTTPEAPELQAMLAEMLDDGCGAAVMEVSSHAIDQKRVAHMDFDAAIFTNLTPEHLDYHKTLEAYFEVKRRLFESLMQSRKKPVAIINVDDAYGCRLASELGQIDVLTYGFSDRADVRVEGLDMHPYGVSFKIASPWGSAAFEMPLIGKFNVSNALGAITACAAQGISLELAGRALFQMEAVPGRLERISNPGGASIFVDYAHTSDALEQVLKSLKSWLPDRRIGLVFGCGGDRDQSKRPMMGKVARERADFVVLTNDNARSEDPAAIIDQILSGMHDSGCSAVAIELDREAAIAAALDWAKPNDVVLVAGKGHETCQEIGHTVFPFDDRATIRRLLEN